MIAAVAERRAVGDWRGACAAADVDVCLRLDSVRRDYGSEIADQLLAALSSLAPDLLRWHLPRRAHGSGELLAGLLVPLAEFADGRRQLTLAAATPQFALDAGQRIVLVLLGGGEDAATRAVLEAVRLKYPSRLSLVRHREFWSADAAPALAELCDVTSAEHEITSMQDAGRFAEAWEAGGFSLCLPGTPARTRWLAALPVRIPGLISRVREAVPGVDSVVLRSGVGALVLSGLNSTTGAMPTASVAGDRSVLDLPVVPNAVWSRVTDADLLRLGYLAAHELHPLIAAAVLSGPRPTAPEPDEWLYREVPFIAGPCQTPDASPALWISCGANHHRVAYADGAWHIVDHVAHATREALLARLGGPAHSCQQALDYLTSGRHIIDLTESLLAHGRAAEVRTLIHTHAGTRADPDRITLPTGETVAAALAALTENTLHHRMILAAATRAPESHDRRRRARKGGPARTTR